MGNRTHERLIFQALLRVDPRFLGEELAEWSQPADERDFPDVTGTTVSGLRAGVELGERSIASVTSTTRKAATGRRFAVCVRNEGYEASLERNKIYAGHPGHEAERNGDLRVVDESDEDYLFSADRFVVIDVPAAAKASLLRDS